MQALIKPAVEAIGFELVGIEFRSSARPALLRVYIDSEAGVTVDDCARVSHQVSGVLDVEDPIRGEYALEVSSPGLDRPLFTASDFERFVGHRVVVKMDIPVEGRRKFSGDLLGFEDGEVLLEADGSQWSLALAAVAQARLVPDDSEYRPDTERDSVPGGGGVES